MSPLLDDLLELGSDDRAARLAQLNDSNPTLAAQLATLLRSAERVDASRFLMGSALDGTGLNCLSGMTVGGYSLGAMIGEGGMGSVWQASKGDGPDRVEVAVKLLKLGVCGASGLERFRREGRALARLSHPHIAQLLYAGETRNQPYLVLELVKGQAIDSWCEASRSSTLERLLLFTQVLSAVSHAHSRSILHRDLKPSNILVSAERQVKLLDFGIAKLLDSDDDSTQAAGLTAQANAFTLDYAAPEQLDGSRAAVTTDVYAAGVLLYVLLTGQHPTSRLGAGRIERMRAALEVTPRLMSKAALDSDGSFTSLQGCSPNELARALRGDLDIIAAKALKKDPRERYATVDAFADDLRRFLCGESIQAQADSVLDRLGRAFRHRRTSVMNLARHHFIAP